MITAIKLENVATCESVEFTELQKENFIYGANGAGKTTLSNYLMDTKNPEYDNCSLTWENNTPIETLVYNKRFREKNFSSTGKIPGIFTIGEKSKETTERINEINIRLEQLRTNTIADNKLNLTVFSAYLKTLHSEISENLVTLSQKENQPSSPVELKSHKEIISSIRNAYIEATQKIKEHNDIIDRLSVEKENLKNQIWCYLIKTNEQLISDYNKKTEICETVISKMDEQIREYEKEKADLNEELKKLNKKDITIQAAVDAINDILRNYGFMNFEIVSAQEENTYALKRKDGTLVEDKLSEGETTFITFLYYMQLVHGSLQDDGLEKEKVLVIDDPISSLDSNILFVVSSLIKEELKSVGKAENKTNYPFDS